MAEQLKVNNIDLSNAVQKMSTYMSTTAGTGGNQTQLTVEFQPSMTTQLQNTLAEIQEQGQQFPIAWVNQEGQSYSGQGHITSLNSPQGEVIFVVSQLKQN